MIYTASITTPAQTAQSDPLDTRLRVSSGLIWLFEVNFPPGCCGLVHVQIFDGLYQVIPATPRETLYSDAETQRFDDLYFKQFAPYELLIRTWNLDETFDHKTQVRIGMACSKAEMSRYMPSIAFEDFEKLLAESMARQEKERQKQLVATLETITP